MAQVKNPNLRGKEDGYNDDDDLNTRFYTHFIDHVITDMILSLNLIFIMLQ